MFLHYLKTSLRHLTRHKTYSTINILGLAMGIAFCLLTFLFVRHEWTFDQFHKNSDQIYRVLRIRQLPSTGETIVWPLMPENLGPLLKDNFPQLAQATRVRDLKKEDLWANERQYKERLLSVDTDFLKLFSFSLLQGDIETALNDLNSIVLSESAVQRCFGNENPMGKEIRIATHYWQNELRTFTVRGVLSDPPSNSSIQFGALLPYSVIPPTNAFSRMPNSPMNDASKLNFFVLSDYVFFGLHNQSRIEDVNRGLESFIETYNLEMVRQKVELTMQPLADIHFDQRPTFTLEPPGNPQYAYILTGIALAVLLIACVNFMNLAMARFSMRAREVGVRKIVGAQRGQLMRQFWGESLVVTILAVIIGFALAEFFLPAFNQFTQVQLTMDYVLSVESAVFVFTLLTLIGVISGIYPAAVLSGYEPVTVLKDRLRLGGNGSLRRALVVLQFAASILLALATTVMFQQLDFLKTKDLGLLGDQVVAISTQEIKTPGDFQTRRKKRTQIFSTLRQQLEQYSGIHGITRSDLFQDMDTDFTLGVLPVKLPNGTEIQVSYLDVDRDFIETLGIDLVSGRNFAAEASTNAGHSILVNETLVAQLGLEDPLTYQVPLTRRVASRSHNTRVLKSPEIIGVVKDFHVRSLHQAIPPLVIFLRPEGVSGDFLVRIHPERTAETLAFMAEEWHELAADTPFTYVFLDERFDKLYQTEERWRGLIGYASIFALFVACLGVLGLTTMAVARRTKEFGIRKVLGATTQHIAALLSKEFMVLILIANAITWPVAYYAINRWLVSTKELLPHLLWNRFVVPLG